MEADVSITQIILSLLFVMGLIGLSAFALKWLSEKSNIITQIGTGKRLSLVEAKVLDHKHKLFLVASDDTEYTIISNGTHVEVLAARTRPHSKNEEPLQSAANIADGEEHNG